MKNDIRHYQLWNETEESGAPTMFLNIPAGDAGKVSRESWLEERIARQDKIIAALIQRVEHSMDHQANAYSLFQAAIVLDEEVRARTLDLHTALYDLERINSELKAAKDTAEKLNATKTRFLAAAGHDLLQPLNAARLSLSALKEGHLPEEAAALTAQIDRSLTSIEQLMRALMDISKLDAGVTQPDFRSFPIERILQGLYWDFAHAARQQNLRLRVIGPSAVVYSDPIFLRRIIQNLMSNAIRYTQTGGVVVLCQRRHGELAVSIHDTGIGIADDEQDKIFHEFHRGASLDVRVADGLGLGLAIAKRMAEALGHELRFRSELGRGTVFSVSLPLSDAPASSCPEALDLKSFTPVHEGAFVVIVENDEKSRIAMENLLTRWSCQVVSATGTEEILAALGEIERTPDLVIADFHLRRGGNGLDAIAASRANFRTPSPRSS
ncbi:MAG: hybrid sensor histidine kinase/response regulator [Rhodomicrobium sp.]|nr:hybrid sensor histidine kinase/response regulator [Rhodomicrobium sp.]